MASGTETRFIVAQGPRGARRVSEGLFTWWGPDGDHNNINNINNLPLHSFKGHVNGTPDRHALLSCIAPSPSPGSFCGRTGLAALSLFVLVFRQFLFLCSLEPSLSP